MHVIIVGGGKIGYTLCKDLVDEGHDVVLIDRNQAVLERAMSTADLTVINGNGADYLALSEAGVQNADLVIAVTSSDEINIMCCMLAGKLGPGYTIARVRNPEYSSQVPIFRDSLGINAIINPEMEAARAISRILRYPSALNLETFCHGQISMVSMTLAENCKLDGLALKDFRTPNRSLLISIVNRDGEVTIPDGNFVLRSGDRIHVSGPIDQMEEMASLCGTAKRPVQSVFIVGGGHIGYHLLDFLSKTKMRVKLIESRLERCEFLAATFPKIHIVHADGSDFDFMMEEGVFNYDAFISLTGMDEENVLMSIYAANQKVPKVITKINRTKLLRVLKETDSQTIVTPQRILADQLVRQIRAMVNSEGSNVEALYRLEDNTVEALEFKVTGKSRVIGKRIMDLKIKPSTLIAFIVRGLERIYPAGSDSILAGDRVVIVTKEINFDDIDDILAE